MNVVEGSLITRPGLISGCESSYSAKYLEEEEEEETQRPLKACFQYPPRRRRRRRRRRSRRRRRRFNVGRMIVLNNSGRRRMRRRWRRFTVGRVLILNHLPARSMAPCVMWFPTKLDVAPVCGFSYPASTGMMDPTGRAFHSSTSQVNVSAFVDILGALGNQNGSV